MDDFKVAIIVPFVTWNPLVEECERHCLLINYDNFTLVLVPNELETVPEEIARNPLVKVVPSHTNNISHKRNQGIAACPDAEYIACIDSDAYPTTDWLRNAMTVFRKDPDIWCVSGPNISPSYSSNWRKGVANALKSFIVNGHRSFMRRRSSDQYVIEVYSCNMFLKRQVIEEIGGFDESLETGEDTDICRRISRINKKIFFANNVVVYHHNRPLVVPFLKQRITAGYSVPTLLKREFGFSALLFFLPLAFSLFIFLGWLPALFYPSFLLLWFGCIVFYIFFIVKEALKWSEKPSEIPYTVFAMIIGNIGPGIGTFWALLGVSIDIGKFFTNFDPRNNPM